MAGDSERRFEMIMQKLTQSPSFKPKRPFISSNGIGAKRPDSGLRVSRGSGGSAPSCRPWDRGDLMRRLATFKAMTWFGKPKVIDPINCARRGWINVEMDIISCEACDARLLFSTPSSWTLQQVEKAAAVFSLKLDSGHKLLCPWIDNACDEALAFFPPTPPPALLDSYKERSAALLRLKALPVVSSSAIRYMRSPQLEQFLSQSICLPIALDNGITLADNHRGKDIVDASENDTATVYHQAHKMISLCGWEPRLLPYVVAEEDQTPKSSGERFSEETGSHVIYASDPSAVEGGDATDSSLGQHQYDPSSVVLDCRLCGACVGLWAFASVQRPLEIFTLVADPIGKSKAASGGSDLVNILEASEDEISRIDNQNIYSSKRRPFVLNLTIAGGPPPTKQNFRPIVSFPIIGRHLRAELASRPAVTDYSSLRSSSKDPGSSQLHMRIDDASQKQLDVCACPGVTSEGTGLLKRKRSEIDSCISESNNVNDPLHLKGGSQSVQNGLSIEEKGGSISSEGKSCDTQEVLLSHGDNGKTLGHEKIIDNIVGESCTRSTTSEGAKDVLIAKDISSNIEAGVDTCTTSKIDTSTGDSKAGETNSVADIESACNPNKNTSEVDTLNMGRNSICALDGLSDLASDSTIRPSSTNNIEAVKENVKASQDLETNEQEIMLPLTTNKEGESDHGFGDNLKLHKSRRGDDFDPIRQHRPFCPWTRTEDGKHTPGWRLTLAALVQENKDSSPDPHKLDSTSTLGDEGDDPIVSIRKLFMSPPSKRLKSNR